MRLILTLFFQNQITEFVKIVCPRIRHGKIFEAIFLPGTPVISLTFTGLGCGWCPLGLHDEDIHEVFAAAVNEYGGPISQAIELDSTKNKLHREDVLHKQHLLLNRNGSPDLTPLRRRSRKLAAFPAWSPLDGTGGGRYT